MDITRELLGAWATEAAEADSPDAAPVWRWEIPANARVVSSPTSLDPIGALARDQTCIEQASERLSRFVEAWASEQPAQPKSLEEHAASPEDALARTLQGIQSPQAKGLLDPLQSVREEFEAFVGRVRELVSHYAVIETSVGGVVVARTLVGWTGDFQSFLRQDATAEQARLHHRNVRAALARRAALIRLLGVISANAAKIVLRLATPGAQLLVLPALWQFVRDVIAELQRAERQAIN